MFEFLARSVIALVIGVLFLIAMLCAFASEAIGELVASRRKTTHLRRNRRKAAQSYRLTIEEAQS
ncbi:MAG: hypothetical protein ACREV5_22710 [Steroidobacter sp.]